MISSPLPGPIAKKQPKQFRQLGFERTDLYAWLKDENWQAVMQDPTQLSDEIRAHLVAENLYTDQVMAPWSALRDEIFEEMKNRQEPEESSVPMIDGPFAYGHAYRTGDQHGVYKRYTVQEGSRNTTDPQNILDADILSAETKGYFDLGSVSHSPDHQYLAYCVDRNGSESYEVFIKPMFGKAVSTGIKNSTGHVEWATDSKTLFWVERDENQRPDSVYYQDIFEKSAKPKLVYKETDPGFFVSLSKSESDAFIEISAHNHTTSEIHLIPAGTPTDRPICFRPRETGVEYSLHEQGDYFYVLTNINKATDFQIMRVSIVSALQRDRVTTWEPYIPHKAGEFIVGMETYHHFLVRLVRKNALPSILIRNMSTDETHEIAMPEAAYALGLAGGFEFDTPWLRLSYSSPTTPSQIFDYHMENRERVLLKTQSIPSGHDANAYQTERLIIPARDGAEIPVTLLYRKDTNLDGRAPLLLYGYGSYGITIPAAFRTSILSLVDRGFVYAIAHIRGGQSKGYQWYLDGKLKNKPNTFKDFVDVGNGLCERGYTARGRIVAHGGSAGGLLVGAALNLDPDLFGGVIGAVPFVDVLTTMSDAALPLTPPEWPEWGNPLEDHEAYELIASYSPYDNITTRHYPPVLITAGLTDPRVTYWEPAKWAAKLRDAQQGFGPILLKTNMDAGHQGEAGRYDSLKEVAFEYAFAVALFEEE